MLGLAASPFSNYQSVHASFTPISAQAHVRRHKVLSALHYHTIAGVSFPKEAKRDFHNRVPGCGATIQISIERGEGSRTNG